MKVKPENMPQWEALNRALQALQSLPNLDTEAQLAGINAILKKMDSLKGGRPSNSFPIDSEAFGAAYACYVTEEVMHKDATQHIMDKHFVSDRQAEAILEKLKPKVLEYGKFIEKLRKLSIPK